MKTRFKPKFNIKKGDSVVVITGDDKDLKKPRKVLEIITEKKTDSAKLNSIRKRTDDSKLMTVNFAYEFIIQNIVLHV